MADLAPRYGAYGHTLIVINSVCLAVALTVFLIRIYTKAAIVKRAHWDDLTLTLGVIFLIITYAGSIAATVRGANLVAIPDLNFQSQESQTSVMTIWLESVFVSLALGLIKLSVLLMFYTIFRPFRWIRISAYVGFVLIAGFYGGFWIYVMVAITPRPGMSWIAAAIRPQIFDANRANIPQGIAGLIFDVFLLVLPIRAVMSLQMTMQRKLGVCLIFASGLLACVASGISLRYRMRLANVMVDTSTLVPFQICIQVELNAGVLCVCMPSVAKCVSFHRLWFAGVKERLEAMVHRIPIPGGDKNAYLRPTVLSSSDPQPGFELARREKDRQEDDGSGVTVHVVTEVSVTEERRTLNRSRSMGTQLRNDLIRDSIDG